MRSPDLEAGNRALALGAYTQAFEIFNTMVDGGEDPAFFKLCEMAINKQLNAHQAKELKEKLESAAHHRNEAACYNCAVLIERGVLFEQNVVKAATLFRRACGSSTPEAYAALARLYIAHRGEFKAIRTLDVINLLEDGVRYGDPGAAYLLGMLYSKGELVNRCLRTAGKLLFAAERFGHREAIALVAIMKTMGDAHEFIAQEAAGKSLYFDMRDRNVSL
jgi:TPR repeat protein